MKIEEIEQSLNTSEIWEKSEWAKNIVIYLLSRVKTLEKENELTMQFCISLAIGQGIKLSAQRLQEFRMEQDK